MTDLRWVAFAVLFFVAVAIAYALGARGRRQPPAAKAPEDKPTPPPSEPAHIDAEKGDGAGEKKEKKEEKEKKKDEKPPGSTGTLARLDYEEDAEIDPTRIGGGPAPKPPAYQPPVKKIVYDEDAATEEPTRAESLFLVSASAQTDRGMRRKRNEDSLLALESASLFVVADGMGGYAGGERASQLAVKIMGDAYRTGQFDAAAHEGVPKQASELARAMQMANAAILETAKANPELAGMGTTLVAARFSGNKKRVYIGHVGDSRCYRLRKGVLKQMTADHTMADHGVQGPSAAHLSRAVGIWPTVPIDIIMGVPQGGDAYLLCSDGLTKMVSDENIAKALDEEADSKAAVERLIREANERGGKDNVTVVLVRVVSKEQAAGLAAKKS